ncbi:phosphoenolpyruvate hydrolase family protein [Acidisoma cladoniae]|uniref:phosphoenolpyruvate hydrolase family protein n=1 Tax=Acidisoma cladoniae TaxID=3040935 RepID=UPI00254D985D|nr:phosphoenolpyruvate hydrolase family protein [Acidisoma sp. PAMC 29798]
MIASAPASFSEGSDFLVLAPHLAGLSAELGDLVGILPIGSINQTLLTLVRTPSAIPVYAAILPTDPFLGGDALFRELAARGVSAVVNFPTTGLAQGEFRRALETAAMDHGHELQMLGRATSFGLRAMATVFSYDQAMQAVAEGIDRLLLHPGLTTGDADLDQRLAEGVETLVRRLVDGGHGDSLVLYRHPSFGTRLEAAGRLVPALLDWGIVPEQDLRC